MAHYIHYSGNAVSRFAPNNLMSLLPRQWKTFSVVNERELFTANFYCVFLVLMSHVLYLALTFGYNFILILYTTSPFLKTHNWLGLRKLSLQHKYWYQSWRTCRHCSFLFSFVFVNVHTGPPKLNFFFSFSQKGYHSMELNCLKGILYNGGDWVKCHLSIGKLVKFNTL